MTVSRAFNHPTKVKSETREKIFKIASELNYRPNIIARSMRTRITQTIGVMVPNIMNPFFGEIVHGIDECCRSHDYNVLFVNTENDYAKEALSLEMFIHHRVDGILLNAITGDRQERTFAENIIAEHIPLVLVDRYIPNIACSYVITDNFKAGYEATRYLLDGGHTRIGMISSPQKIRIFQQRLKGSLRAQTEYGLHFRKENLAQGEASVAGGYIAAENLLSREPRPTAIFAMCDFMAFGVYKFCKDKNIPIPEELSLISIDDVFPSSLLTPPLTTMAQQKYRMGFESADLLIRSIQNKDQPIRKVVIAAPLVERASCKRND